MSFVTLCLLFDALAEQGNILKNPKDENGKNLFSLVFVLGIIICFFKLLSDLLLIYGATIVSCTIFGFFFGFCMGLCSRSICTSKVHRSMKLTRTRLQQTTKEVSVWLIINLCAILYIFANMVFLYVLLVGHETLIHKNTVLWIEVTIFMWNGECKFA